MGLARKFFKIVGNKIKYIDTITTKLLMLVLFVTVIPLFVITNFSVNIVNQNIFDSSQSKLNFYINLFETKYNSNLNELNFMTNKLAKELSENLVFNKSFDERALNNNFVNNKNSYDFYIAVDKDLKVFTNLKKNNKEKFTDRFKKMIEQVFLGDTVRFYELIDHDASTSLCQIVAAPVFDKDGRISGALFIGKSLFNNVLKNDGAFKNVIISVYKFSDNKFKVISSNTNLSSNILNFTDQKELFNQMKNNEYSSLRTDGTIYKNEFIKNSNDNVIGLIQYQFSVSELLNSARNNIALINLIALISLIVAIAIGALLARTITSPILILVDAAKNIASGNLTTRVKNKGSDEIFQLSEKFNEMAESLLLQQQLRDNFVATLTHDLKVPMLAQNQTVKYMIEGAYGQINQDQKEILELIKSTNLSSLEMVGTLLEVYRYDTGNVQLLKTDFNAVQLLQEAVEETNTLCIDKKIAVSVESNKDIIMVNADKREIKRVFHNLISNAIINGIHRGNIVCRADFIGENEIYVFNDSSEINTTLNESLDISNSLLITVKDDGIGIIRDDIKHLFKRFSLSKGRKPAGTGLGLYYSKQVVSKHSGYIWVESVEGKGSEFRFTIPFSENVEEE